MSKLQDRLAEELHKRHRREWNIDFGVDRCRVCPGEAERLVASGIVADPVEVLTDALHPEFGTEWREPDGVIWKAIQSAKAEFQYVKSDLEHARSAGVAFQRLYAEAKTENEALRAKVEALAEDWRCSDEWCDGDCTGCGYADDLRKALGVTDEPE